MLACRSDCHLHCACRTAGPPETGRPLMTRIPVGLPSGNLNRYRTDRVAFCRLGRRVSVPFAVGRRKTSDGRAVRSHAWPEASGLPIASCAIDEVLLRHSDQVVTFSDSPLAAHQAVEIVLQVALLGLAKNLHIVLKMPPHRIMNSLSVEQY